MKFPIKKLPRSQFPELLTHIPDPPEKLCIRGTLPAAHLLYLAVVGSRKASPYGTEACERIIAGLAGHPIVIVSGLALGIDSIAHRAALKAGLTTVAVPGSGLDPSVLYPASHKRLAEEILSKGGALLSEFEPKFQATPWSFPQRNRIMAGMSHGVLVVEAAEKSGTLITSKFASEYNREVFAVPGSVFASQSAGPHMLIRLGATPVRGSADILEAFGLAEKKAGPKDYGDCSPHELILLKLLEQPMHKDELIAASALPAREANIAISMLEIKGYVEELLGELRRT